MLYRAYQLTIESDVALAAQSLNSTPEQIDIIIKRAAYLKHRHFYQGEPQYIAFAGPDYGHYEVISGSIICYNTDNLEPGIAPVYIQGSCMGAALLQRGYIVLHGNAISFDGHSASLYVGDQGAGKSTTTTYHYLNGAHLVCDDVCAIRFDDNGQAFVLPGFCQLKLWQDSIDLLGLNNQSMQRISQHYEKYRWIIDERFIAQPIPLKEIIELHAYKQENLSGVDKLSRLIHHSYRFFFNQRMHQKQHYIQQLVTLGNGINYRYDVRPTLCTST